jgi:SAM-dependent methyltransferase
MAESAKPNHLERVEAAYDAVAVAYDEQFANELDAKPLERALLIALCELSAGATVADVGCGPGHVTHFLAQHHDAVVGIDVSAEMIGRAGLRNPLLHFEIASMLRLPLADYSCGGVVALYSIIHFDAEERARAFAEMHRVLRPGGRLLVSFHVDAAGIAAGDVSHLDAFLGHRVDMDGYFLAPSTVIDELDHAGLRVTAKLEREPIPAVEFPSRRCYLLAQRSA